MNSFPICRHHLWTRHIWTQSLEFSEDTSNEFYNHMKILKQPWTITNAWIYFKERRTWIFKKRDFLFILLILYKYIFIESKYGLLHLYNSLALWWPRWTDPLIAPMIKTLKLAIYLFLEFWLQIWFQKYYISSNGIQFLINKHKNRGKF
jgi:hypothetical protein